MIISGPFPLTLSLLLFLSLPFSISLSLSLLLLRIYGRFRPCFYNDLYKSKLNRLLLYQYYFINKALHRNIELYIKSSLFYIINFEWPCNNVYVCVFKCHNIIYLLEASTSYSRIWSIGQPLSLIFGCWLIFGFAAQPCRKNKLLLTQY